MDRAKNNVYVNTGYGTYGIGMMIGIGIVIGRKLYRVAYSETTRRAHDKPRALVVNLLNFNQ